MSPSRTPTSLRPWATSSMASIPCLTTKNDRISATYLPGLFYEFDFGLKCTQVYWGNGYERLHGEMVKAGKI